VAADPSAPDLGGFASREWIAGLLDPDQVKTRKYFGNSKFRTGDMAGFVDDMLSDLDDEEKEEIETLVIALSAEARLPAQQEIDQQDAERIEQGRELLSDWGCTDCHRFHDEGDYTGPDLTGYGSAKWLAEFICDPAKGASKDASALRFYGDDNYGMPSYRKYRPEAIEGEGPEADQARKELEGKEGLNLLAAEEIQLLVDMLRGALPEPEKTEPPKTEP
jgi:ubiquinol-cytochrome c reductase cytochrome b subunit